VTDQNYLPSRVRSNFHIDVFSAVGAGVFVSVLVAFMPVVVRRMGGSATDVAIVICAPFIGHLLAPFFTYLLAHLAPVKVVAGTSTLARSLFLVGMLVATTPLMLALTTVTFWIITISNVAAYTALMRGIYPGRDRAHVMGKVRVGSSLAGIVAATIAGLYIDLVPAQWVFAAAALISLPGSIAFFKIQHASVGGFGTRRPALDIARDVWADRRYRRLMLSFLIFGWGNLMNFAVFPIMLVDHFDAPNTFVGILSAAQSATMIVAYVVVGRLIDRGSSLRQTFIGTLLILLVPIGYLLAPSYWFLLPVAVGAGSAQSAGGVRGGAVAAPRHPRIARAVRSVVLARRVLRARRAPSRPRLHGRRHRDHVRRRARARCPPARARRGQRGLALATRLSAWTATFRPRSSASMRS
jgi:MFS family permease